MERAYVYLVRCSDGSLYTGMTTRPCARLSAHVNRQAASAKYTKSHPVRELSALFRCRNRSDALRLEARIKQLTHAQKELLSKGELPPVLSPFVVCRCSHPIDDRFDRIFGSLLGGAVGDALGYAVEFDSHQSIVSRYGEQGITTLPNKAVISDDTQMTLFTLAALLKTKQEGNTTPTALKTALLRGYLDWYSTQSGCAIAPYTALRDEPFLYARRAPGMTCLYALEQQWKETRQGTHPIVRYSTEKRINTSKGCGGVMRVAPIGFTSEAWMPMTAAALGAEAAALTHGHPMGWLSAAMLSEWVLNLLNGLSLESSLRESMDTVEQLYREIPQTEAFLSLMRRAEELAQTERKDAEAIHALGGGWVGEEALAIAVYCVLHHAKDANAALIAAANHDGDSDSTAAIVGNVLGAALGAARLKEMLAPMHFENVEGLSLLERLAREAAERL